ncbi:MAG: HAMP domain-containing protein, partial [Alphaproteobacteria bacterium]
MMPNNKSVNKDYLTIAIIIILCVIGISLIFSISFYFSYIKNKNNQLRAAANRIEELLNESFDYSTYLAKILGDKVVQPENIRNLNHIADLLNGNFVTNDIAKKIFAYTIFDWINENNQIVVSGPFGVLKEPKDISFRNYSKMAVKNPGKLYFDPPAYGIPSGQYILPAGIGIADKKGKFQGIISMGFNLTLFTEKLAKEIKKEGVSFIILNLDLVPVFKSADNIFLGDKKDFFQNYKYDFENLNSDFLKSKIIYNEINYEYISKLSKYPFIILVGFNKVALMKDLADNFLPRIAEIILIGLISISLLAYLKFLVIKPILNLAQVADNIAKGDVTAQVPILNSKEMNVLGQALELVKKAFMREQEYRDELEQKVVERTRELQLALEAKTEFLNNMSHEVRTPV